LLLKYNQDLFLLCFRYVDNLSPSPQTFNAKYGLFRGLISLFGILGGASFLLGLWNLAFQATKQPVIWILPPLCALLAWLSYGACEKRAEYYAKCVYHLFISGVAAKPGE
jgi:hypothetical protein